MKKYESKYNMKWISESDNGMYEAINKGLPKTKMTNIPFRMEMSAFSRLNSSIPVIGDIGLIWPILASKVAQELDIELDFISAPQQTDEGKEMREMLVSEIESIDMKKIHKISRNRGNFTVRKI